MGRGHGGVREGRLLPARSRSLLGKSEFIISQEIINCWADKRHRSAPPETPSKGAVRGGRDKLRLRSSAARHCRDGGTAASFGWGSPRVWSPPGVPRERQGGTEQSRGLRGDRLVPAPCRAVPAVSVLPSRVPVPAWPRRDVPLGSGGRFPPRRRFPGDCGASARPAPADQITAAARPKFPASPSVPRLKSHRCSPHPATARNSATSQKWSGQRVK